MRSLDWIVLVGSLVFIVAYGLRRGHGSDTVNKYLLAGKTMPWYAMALSIMATQASAITFISTTGQAYVDGMRFVQFYFGLPLAMVILCATAVPIFHRAGVYTAYEYLEQRFDAKTRVIVSFVFLIQRGLACGLSLYAPAVVLTVILGWPDRYTTLIMGATVVVYAVLGGIQAVTWTDFQQMLIMMLGLAAALFMAVWLLPPDVTLSDALAIAGAAGRLNPVTTKLDFSDQYNLFSGLLGGMFLALAYFGCDQSQVQRYLTGRSIAQSRISLLFNAVAKVPLQFFILLTGAMVFAFFTFVQPPQLFHNTELLKVRGKPEFGPLERRYHRAFEDRRLAASAFLSSRSSGDLALFQSANAEFEAARKETSLLVSPDFKDTNYIFLTFVTRYLPAGVVGLVLAAIFAAAMSTISAEINSLATVTVIDVYKRFLVKDGADRHYLNISRAATAFWGFFAIVTAEFGKNLGSLVEAVNKLGSLFYGGILGVFALAMFFPRVGGTGAFLGILAGEAAIFTAHYTGATSFLWYNVIGASVVVATGLVVSRFESPRMPQS
jgi:Na+/proline symporter